MKNIITSGCLATYNGDDTLQSYSKPSHHKATTDSKYFWRDKKTNTQEIVPPTICLSIRMVLFFKSISIKYRPVSADQI